MYRGSQNFIAVERYRNEARGRHEKVASCKEEVYSYLEKYSVAMGRKLDVLSRFRRYVVVEKRKFLCGCERNKQGRTFPGWRFIRWNCFPGFPGLPKLCGNVSTELGSFCNNALSKQGFSRCYLQEVCTKVASGILIAQQARDTFMPASKSFTS